MGCRERFRALRSRAFLSFATVTARIIARNRQIDSFSLSAAQVQESEEQMKHDSHEGSSLVVQVSPLTFLSFQSQ